MATAALPAGAVQPRDAPQIQSMRLLATAYDHNWKLKKVVPQDAIPQIRSPSPVVSRNPSKASRKSGGSKARPQAVEADRSKSKMSTSSEVHSPKSPLSPKSRKAKEAFAKILLDDDDRPGSARSEDSKGSKSKSKSKEEVQQEPESDDERVEKPLATWSEEAGVPLDLSKDAVEVFCEMANKPARSIRHAASREQVLFGHPFNAANDLGRMNQEAFGKACCRIADVKDLDSLPPGFLDQAMKASDRDSSGDIDFAEFLYFYYKFSFSEEVLIGPEERLIRAAARQHDIPYDEIGKYKYVFDQTDTNKNGRVAFDEFKILIQKLMKVPRGEELPESRLKDMWREATRTSGGKDLDFIVFVGWYKRYFMGDDDYDESPFEAYYHNIRRVSAYDSNQHH